MLTATFKSVALCRQSRSAGGAQGGVVAVQGRDQRLSSAQKFQQHCAQPKGSRAAKCMVMAQAQGNGTSQREFRGLSGTALATGVLIS